MSKKVLVISGSPRKGGNSDLLCDEFIKGAQDAGHIVEKLSLREKIVLRLLPIFKFNRLFNCQTLDYLHRLGLLDRPNGIYTVNRAGKMYFRIKRKERLRFIIPTVISIPALCNC